MPRPCLLAEDAAYYAVADYRLHHGELPLGWLALLAQPSGVRGARYLWSGPD